MSDEVETWYLNLSTKEINKVDEVLNLLETRGNKLRMPHSRSLGDGLFELRFDIDKTAWRITYAFEPKQHVITLTKFRKQRNNEKGEVRRARKALFERRNKG